MADYEQVLAEVQAEISPFVDILKVSHWDNVAGVRLDQNSNGFIYNAEGWISLNGVVSYKVVNEEKQDTPSGSFVMVSISRHELGLDRATMGKEADLALSSKVIIAEGCHTDLLLTNTLTRPTFEELQGLRRAINLCKQWLYAPTREDKLELRAAAQDPYKK